MKLSHPLRQTWQEEEQRPRLRSLRPFFGSSDVAKWQLLMPSVILLFAITEQCSLLCRTRTPHLNQTLKLHGSHGICSHTVADSGVELQTLERVSVWGDESGTEGKSTRHPTATAANLDGAPPPLFSEPGGWVRSLSWLRGPFALLLGAASAMKTSCVKQSLLSQ